MNLAQKTTTTAIFALLGLLAVRPPRDVKAQIAMHPSILSKSAGEVSHTSEIARLPQMGGIKFDASLFVHVPPSKKLRLFSNGDGIGRLRVLDNLMRYDVAFSGGHATSVIWTDFKTDISIQEKHAPFTSDEPILVESFIANLNKAAVIRLPDRHYDKNIIIDGKPRKDLIVEDYYFDHKLVTTDHAFDGHVYMLKFEGGYIPILIDGSEKKVADDDCGQYKPFIMQILELKSVTPNASDMKPSSLPPASQIKRKLAAAQHCTASP